MIFTVFGGVKLNNKEVEIKDMWLSLDGPGEDSLSTQYPFNKGVFA